jgi:hypothetical protein
MTEMIGEVLLWTGIVAYLAVGYLVATPHLVGRLVSWDLSDHDVRDFPVGAAGNMRAQSRRLMSRWWPVLTIMWLPMIASIAIVKVGLAAQGHVQRRAPVFGYEREILARERDQKIKELEEKGTRDG